MTDDKTAQHLECVEPRLARPESDAGSLEKWKRRWLRRLASRGWSPATCKNYGWHLNRFLAFAKRKRVPFERTFCPEIVESFRRQEPAIPLSAIRGLAGYMFEKGVAPAPIPKKGAARVLPGIYEEWMSHRREVEGIGDRLIGNSRSVLGSFRDWLESNGIAIESLRIENVDEFLACRCKGVSHSTGRGYRAIVRGFLRWAFRRGIVGRDLAPLIVGPRCYCRAKPPKFLRAEEVKRLFEGFEFREAGDIRDFAMVHLGYGLGLRPSEIASLTLDDISFERGLATVRNRKNAGATCLPVPAETLKAVAAYVIRARPESRRRRLFLSLRTPHDPVKLDTVRFRLKKALARANPSATAYWLRHTFAQNLLESGATVFEVKEMLGHVRIESTKNYLCVHPKLMRKVLFDETV